MNLEYFCFSDILNLFILFSVKCSIKLKKYFFLGGKKVFLESNLVPFISQELSGMIRPVLLH